MKSLAKRSEFHRKATRGVNASGTWPQGDGWLSTFDMAKRLHRTPATVRNWCRSGVAAKLGLSATQDPLGVWWLRMN